ncbi:DUF4175 family protein [Fervidibacter sacchari]|uniref:DUF4175 family protein n=1 Tax=Candidatus Fervidibacter sacchari TaxID=1448929 RepID=A0ABT2ESU8_9BACT|nr:DUF4175 family protein [Candidatus Fervidibacter sacchari]MCS3920501.1 hypothetical protein [Candidatus Fervidibacter sacchari]WKU14546.1 DUF4175 family protein [Candidatus Fervidibacter sacchari]
MVRAQTFRIGERFEIARALFQAVKWLAWKRRLLALLAAFGLLVASVSSVLLAFTILLRFAEILPALTFIWLARFVIALGIVSSALSIWVGVRWLVRERLDQVLRAVDDAFGGETFRNAFDLANLREDETFVSPQFARVAIAEAWRKWQEANSNGLAKTLTTSHRKRAVAVWTFTVPLLVLVVLSVRFGWLSLSAFLEFYRDAQAVLAFEKQGRLRLSVIWSGKETAGEMTVLKSSVVTAEVEASSQNLPLPKRLQVWLVWQAGEKVERAQMEKVGDGEFKAKLVVTESSVLYAVSGRVKSNRVKIQAVAPPRIAEWLVTVEPPSYTNLPSETFSLAKWQTLTVLKGSKVTALGTATESLTDARPEFADNFSLPSANSLSVEDRTVKWEGVVLAPVKMRLRLVDKFGFVGETDWLTINTRPDNPPKVTVLAGSDSTVAGGFLPLTVRAEDDFGVSEVSLQFGLGDEKQPPNSPLSVPLNIAPSQQVEQTLALPIPADAAGKVLWVRAVAKDNDAVSGAKLASSNWLSVPIREPEELAGTLQEWLERLRVWESWLQKGEWEKAQQELSRWLQRWQELIQQAQWSETPLTHQWLANWLSHWQGHLQRKDLEGALQELWQMQRALERSLAEQKLAELAQEITALRAQQEALHDALRRHARPSSLASNQQQVAERTKEFFEELKREADRWEKLDEPTVAFALQDVVRILQQRPTEQAMRQAQGAMEQELREMALLRTHEALTDLREAEERLTSPTQSPLAQLYRRERNLLAQLLEQTERLRRDQSSLRRETENPQPSSLSTPKVSPQLPSKLLSPPSPPDWGEVESLTAKREPTLQAQQRSLAERQQQLRQRAEQLRRPLNEALRAVPQLSPEALHNLQEATAQMSDAAKALQQGLSETIRRQAARHQRAAESALQQLAENLRQALMMEQGTATQQMGAGENEAMALAQRQAQILRETQRLHQRQMQGQNPSQMRLRQLGSEEGAIRNALSRMEGFFGDALPPELRQRMQQSSQHLRWLEQNLPEGRLGKDAQQKQQHVLETLLQLAQILSGQQGNQQGQQQTRQGQTPSRPDINWGRFVEHGPPMRQVPEALQGVKGGASFAEPTRSISVPPPTPSTMLRPSVLPAYRDSVRKYQQQIR